jgi:hypothetical protein
VLGVRPALGRGFRDAETWSNAPRVVILGQRIWRELFGADLASIGRTVELGGRPVEVVGVLPANFGLPGVDVDIWQPIRWDPAGLANVSFRRAHWVHVIARLRAGVTLERAEAGLQTVVTRLQREYRNQRGWARGSPRCTSFWSARPAAAAGDARRGRRVTADRLCQHREPAAGRAAGRSARRRFGSPSVQDGDAWCASRWRRACCLPG